MFSCEKIKKKRDLLLKDGQMDHFFADVEDFERKRGYCFRCRTTHEISPMNCQIDVLEAGPSCKDVSRLNVNRASHAGCYASTKDTSGTSGGTYTAGFKQAGLICMCILLMFAPHSKFIDGKGHARSWCEF